MPMQPQTFSRWKRNDGALVGITVLDPNPAPCTKITNSHIGIDVHTGKKWLQLSVIENYAGSNRTKRTHATLDPEAARALYELLRDVFNPGDTAK